MDFLVVNDSKLKIVMSRDEMKKYNIETDSVDCDEPKVRRSFWKILDEAKLRCGFDSSGDKVLIQFYPLSDGCEVFVTKLGTLSPVVEKTIVRSGRIAMLKCRVAIYRFSSFSSLTVAARLLNTEECERAPRVFYDGEESYYIIAEERIGSGRAGEISAIKEFSSDIPSSLAPYVIEHSTELNFDVIRRL